MAVQAHFYSDHNNNNNNNNNNMGCFNLPQDWCYMSNSSLFGFGDGHQQDQGLLDAQKVVNFDSGYRNLASTSNSRGNGMIGVQNLSSELERQRLEMNCFLHLQNEKLKAVLNEETRKREMMLMHNYESKMKAIFDEKDEVLNTATIRAKKLQNYVMMAEKEVKIWEKKAIESEAIMRDLNKKLIQARATTHEDAESVCNGDNDHNNNNNINNNNINNGTERQEKMVCKMCHVRSTCVLLLPCKHLCCCTHCEGLVMFCPVCETVKNGSLEVFFGLN